MGSGATRAHSAFERTTLSLPPSQPPETESARVIRSSPVSRVHPSPAAWLDVWVPTPLAVNPVTPPVTPLATPVDNAGEYCVFACDRSYLMLNVSVFVSA